MTKAGGNEAKQLEMQKVGILLEGILNGLTDGNEYPQKLELLEALGSHLEQAVSKLKGEGYPVKVSISFSKSIEKG